MADTLRGQRQPWGALTPTPQQGGALMARSVYKICTCKDPVKCRHAWWFSYKRAGAGERRLRKSLDVVLETHIDSKTLAEQEAERLRIGIIDDTLPARTRELLGLPPSATPMRQTLTVSQLLELYRARHLARTATLGRQVDLIGVTARTRLPRPDGTTHAFGAWLVVDVTADTLERLREARAVRTMHVREQDGRRLGSNPVGGAVAANRSLRLMREAFNWGLRVGYVERTPFKRDSQTIVKLTKERSRSRRLQAGEEAALFAVCGPQLRAVVEAALETGCRKGELLNLQWHQVQLTPRPELWLPADKTKTGTARRVPLSTRLQAVLAMRTHDPAGHPFPPTACVFGNELGQRIEDIQTAWETARRGAKLEDLRFHDLRREAGSRWMDAGVPLATIQRWLGHANISQTSTYLATTAAGEHDAMRRFEERLGRLTPIDTDGETPRPDQASSDQGPNEKPQ
jgi:integrase